MVNVNVFKGNFNMFINKHKLSIQQSLLVSVDHEIAAALSEVERYAYQTNLQVISNDIILQILPDIVFRYFLNL